MKNFALALAALTIGGFLSAPASAGVLNPAATASIAVADANVEQVRDAKRSWKKRSWKNRQWRGNRGYYSKRRYNRGPAGWRRYDSRPYNWSTRGCVVVGPVWFCP